MQKEISRGQIIVDEGANVWPHEMLTAEALAAAGYKLRFLRRSMELRARSADLLIDGELWEMKAPRSDKPRAIDKNIRKALHQASCVVFDSRRMKRIPDAVVERELRKSALGLKRMRHLLFVNKKGRVIDIK